MISWLNYRKLTTKEIKKGKSKTPDIRKYSDCRFNEAN